MNFSQIADGAWSPDSRWITYSKTGTNTANSIYLYSIDQKKLSNVTSGFTVTQIPFSIRKESICIFISARFYYPSSGVFDQRFNYYDSTGIFALTLKADEPSPFLLKAMRKKPRTRRSPRTNRPKSPLTRPMTSLPRLKQLINPKMQKRTTRLPSQFKLISKAWAIESLKFPCPPGLYQDLSVRKGKMFYISVPQEALEAGDPGAAAPTPNLSRL